MLIVGRVLTTNVSQIILCQLLFRATMIVRLGSCLSLLLEYLTAQKLIQIPRNLQLSWEGLIHERKRALLVPPLSLMLVK